MSIPFSAKFGGMILLGLLIVQLRKVFLSSLHGIMVVMMWLWKVLGTTGDQGRNC
ncbi:hypothetical protein Gogos_010818 [Gossypium gossypioides]|uniref:Uncharacterized protein n=1 Tax=Gossypium gossypioides TaxID=34282 RepID=A0A7J9BMD2_GOSGO|nr:hypothetical protein [Gossypium gossypioides]